MDMREIKVGVLFATTFLLAGCQTDGSTLPSVACEAFGPLSYSRQHDTRITIRGIVGHNAVGTKLCPGVGRWKKH